MRLLFALAGFALSAGLAHAGTVEVNPDKPVASFAVPDSWTVSQVKRGLELKTEDEDVYVWIETYRPNELQTVIDEHNSYWSEQGIEIKGRDVNRHEENGVSVQVVTQNATWEGKPTVVMYLEYDLGLASRSNILITYWASPDGNMTYTNDIQSIIKSMEITEK